jgi:hypothetical protein
MQLGRFLSVMSTFIGDLSVIAIFNDGELFFSMMAIAG